MLELGVVGALQRIGNRDRGNRHAGGEAGEREERMRYAVAGEDHHGALGAEPALDQPLRQRIDLRVRLAISELAPEAGSVALGKEETLGVALDRSAKEPRKRRVMGCQGLRRAIAQAAAGDLLADDAWWSVGDRAERGGAGHVRFKKFSFFSLLQRALDPRICLVKLLLKDVFS